MELSSLPALKFLWNGGWGQWEGGSGGGLPCFTLFSCSISANLRSESPKSKVYLADIIQNSQSAKWGHKQASEQANEQKNIQAQASKRTYKHTNTQTHRHTYKHTNRHTEIHAYKHTNIQAYRRRDTETEWDGRTDGQANIDIAYILACLRSFTFTLTLAFTSIHWHYVFIYTCIYIDIYPYTHSYTWISFTAKYFRKYNCSFVIICVLLRNTNFIYIYINIYCIATCSSKGCKYSF